MLAISPTRSVLGPKEMALFEHALGQVEGVGLSGREMVGVVELISTYVRGAARAAADARRAPEATGISDDQWWSEREPLLTAYDAFDPERFPVVNRVGADGGFDVSPDGAAYLLQYALDSFEFGLARVLDGVQALVDDRAAGLR